MNINTSNYYLYGIKYDTSSKNPSNRLFRKIAHTIDNENKVENKKEEPTLDSKKVINPNEGKYKLILNDYGLEKIQRDRPHKILIDNVTQIVADEPITKEYLEERYKKIQHYFETEYEEVEAKVIADNSVLKDMGIESRFSWRDSWGIVKIDGKFTEIDGDEFKMHYRIYQEKQSNENIHKSHDTGVYFKELNGIKVSFENAKKFEYYVNHKDWKDNHINTLYRKISLAVNLGLIEEGNQNLFSEMYQKEKASYSFRNIKNDTLSQAVLDSIGSIYSAHHETILYEYLFGTEKDFFQNKLNDFAKELEKNPSKYQSTNSKFTFTGDVNLDEGSTEEYKEFITNTLIDFIQKEKDDYIDKNISKDPNYKFNINSRGMVDESSRFHAWFIRSFDTIIDNLRDSSPISSNK